MKNQTCILCEYLFKFKKQPLTVACITVLFLVSCGPAVTEIHWFVGVGNGTSPDQQNVEQAVVRTFNESQSRIKLILDISQYDPSNTESDQFPTDVVANLMKAGEGIDIVGPMGFTSASVFYGKWLDLTPFIQSMGVSGIDPVVTDLLNTQDGQLALPYVIYPSAVLYRKSMFEKAKLNLPPAQYGEKYIMPDGSQVDWDYQTLADVARLLTMDAGGKNSDQNDDGFDRNNVVQYGYALQWQSLLDMAVFYGGFYELYKRSIPAGSFYTGIPQEWKDAWRWYYDGMWGEHPFIPTRNPRMPPSLFESDPSFNNCKVAMTIIHSWYIPFIKTQNCVDGSDNPDWELAVLPLSWPGTTVATLHLDAFYIWKGTKHPKEAYEVMKYLMDSSDFLSVYGGMSARTEDQGAYLAKLKIDHPQIQNWTVFTQELNSPDAVQNKRGEMYMPCSTEVYDRIRIFQELLAWPLQTGPGFQSAVNFDQQIEYLRKDLRLIFSNP
jgi:multiple sugar transport system substrate-binding protein